MVKVSIRRHQQLIMQITIKGHANAAPHGQDLVCAGASSISVGMMNALDQMTPDTCEFQMLEGHVTILVTKVTEQNQLLLEAMICQLQTLQETYNNYITITDQEV